ncbi:ABC transporter substrate-binding protein [Acetobacter thailandicus]|nr:ABC transporter substrate-binding protein [Acetobacter thailandicus]NHN95290.1 ABC transporter substrate-binding protein [Acetobacter thailandicus]
MSMSGPPPGTFPRRTFLLCGLAGAAAAGSAELYHLHRHHHPRRRADGLYHQIRLAWPDADNSPVLNVAAQKNFLTHYNLDLLPFNNPPEDGDEAITALAKGEASFAVAPATTWLTHLNQGLAASLILGVQPGTFRLLVRRATGIQRLNQLLNRTVLVGEHNNAGKLFFATMMRRKGMNSMEKINWKIVPDATLTAPDTLAEADAVVTDDPQGWQLLSTQPGVFSELAGSTTGAYSERTNLVLGISHTAPDTEADAATALTLALKDAAKWSRTHLQETATLMAQTSDGLNAQTIFRMLQKEPVIQAITGQKLREQVAQYCDELQLLGLLPQTADSSALAHRFTHNPLRN